MRIVALALVGGLVTAGLLAACNPTQDSILSRAGGAAGTPEASSPPGASVSLVPARDLYPTISALHEKTISRTCALNNGVCHSSKEYPDIGSLSTLLHTFGQPCNLDTDVRANVHDTCEGAGDHLVIPSLGLDAEIARVDLPAAAAPEVRGRLGGNAVTIWFAKDVSPTAITDANRPTNLEVRRAGVGGGTQVIPLPEVSGASMDAKSISIDVSRTTDAVRRFLDDRFYPWNPSMMRVADVNRNGVLGSAKGVSMLKPGDPMKSYLVLRLIDEAEGDLMPRQCREWDERATLALGCWVAGLKTAPDGTLANALEPIDYDTCAFQPGGAGRCTVPTNVAVGSFEAVEDVIARACGGSACHIGQTTPAAAMDLSPGKARANLIGVPSSQVPTMLRVDPGKPESSYFMCKLDPTCAQRKGQIMPLAGALQGADLEIFRAWIKGGAP